MHWLGLTDGKLLQGRPAFLTLRHPPQYQVYALQRIFYFLFMCLMIHRSKQYSSSISEMQPRKHEAKALTSFLCQVSPTACQAWAWVCPQEQVKDRHCAWFYSNQPLSIHCPWMVRPRLKWVNTVPKDTVSSASIMPFNNR